MSHEFAERAKYNRDWFCLCTTDYVEDIESLFMFPRHPPLKPSPPQLCVLVIMRRRALGSGMAHYIKQDLIFAIIIRICTQQTECFKIYFHIKNTLWSICLCSLDYNCIVGSYNMIYPPYFNWVYLPGNCYIVCVLQLSKKLNNDRNYQEHAHKTMWKKYASLQSEAPLCAIFKKKDYENKRFAKFQRCFNHTASLC